MAQNKNKNQNVHHPRNMQVKKEDNTDRTSSQGRKEASGGTANTNNRGHRKGM